SSRKIVEGINWTQSLKGQKGVDKLVEDGKSKFAGPEIAGKTLGVIGLGAIGVRVANAAVALGMNVVGYDPFLSIDAAWSLSSQVERADDIAKAVANCDYVTLHIPLNNSTRGMFNDELFAKLKHGARLLNFSRGEIVDTAALKNALETGILENYITDFPNDATLELDKVILIPHLGASTPESEELCAQMASSEIRDFLEYGKIKNSVNFPDCEEYYFGKTRVSVIHKNIPMQVGAIAAAFGNCGININNLVNKSKGDWAYTLIDVDSLNGHRDDVIAALNAIDGTVRVRVVKEEE
ncbi:MAG: 3-phosphoglycerate dehydrogenase, partial [Firmicutes bacterium]|nr:3-phosphoglycerate dehydrogenase [Bacillota bacterium]